MRSYFLAVVTFLFVSAAFSQEWGKPVWQDEFNQPSGSPVDPKEWSFDVGAMNVDAEVQIYCPAVPSSPEQTKPQYEGKPDKSSICDPKDANLGFDGEHLVIRAVQHDGRWTSGRLKTAGRAAFQYGRIEARIKLPHGAGIWPAFWALGDDFPKVGWPASGEIDIMENVPVRGGLGPSRISSTVHGTGYSGDLGVRNDIEFPSGQRVDTDFHIYGAIWSPYMIQFYLDDPKNVFFVLTPHELAPGKAWLFNKPFFLILNMAIGGEHSWPGPTDASTPNPATMLVDYVRVYKPSKVDGPRIEQTAPMTETKSSGRREFELPIELTAKPGGGRMYVDCMTTVPGWNCTAQDYVVDFSDQSKSTVKLKLSVQKSPETEGNVIVRAYSVSGDEATQTIHLRLP